MTPEQEAKQIEAEKRAQRAAEERMELAWAVLNDDAEDEAGELAGPFCGCLTCEVREILDAAYPHLKAVWEVEAADV
jgi:hypothetical protein